MALEIAKAGWLYRLSSILRRWKKTWFVLYQDGDLRYFESPNSHEPEARIMVKAVCNSIDAGTMCDTTPPEGKTKDCLLTLNLRDGELKLCAEDPDDMRAWQIALEEARVLLAGNAAIPGLAPPYPGAPLVYTAPHTYDPMQYPGTVVAPGTVMYPRQPLTGQYYYPGQVISAPYGQNTVLGTSQPGTSVVYVNNDPYQYQRRYDSMDQVYGPMGAPLVYYNMYWM